MSKRRKSKKRSESTHQEEQFDALKKQLPRPSFEVEALEPRILLSATALDADVPEAEAPEPDTGGGDIVEDPVDGGGADLFGEEGGDPPQDNDPGAGGEQGEQQDDPPAAGDPVPEAGGQDPAQDGPAEPVGDPPAEQAGAAQNEEPPADPVEAGGADEGPQPAGETPAEENPQAPAQDEQPQNDAPQPEAGAQPEGDAGGAPEGGAAEGAGGVEGTGEPQDEEQDAEPQGEQANAEPEPVDPQIEHIQSLTYPQFRDLTPEEVVHLTPEQLASIPSAGYFRQWTDAARAALTEVQVQALNVERLGINLLTEGQRDWLTSDQVQSLSYAQFRYVPPSQVEHLTAEQMGTIPSHGYLRQWTAEARAELNEAQVQGLDVGRTGIDLLTEGQREWLTSDQVQSLSYAQFRYVPPSQVEHLTAEQMGTIPSHGYLRQWTAEARAELNEAQVQGLDVGRTGIDLLTEGQREWLTSDQAQSLSYAQFRYVPPSQVEHLTAEQMGTIPSHGYLRQWTAEARAELGEAQVQGLDVGRTGIDLLTEGQREWLTSDQVQSLSYAQFRYVPPSHVEHLTPEQIGTIPSNGYLRQWSVEARAELDEAQVQGLNVARTGINLLTEGQREWLTGEQVQSLSYAQFRYVPPSHVEHLTPEQIGTIPSNGYLRQWSAEARAEMDEAQVQGLNVARTGINLLTEGQREWLTGEQVQSLSYAQFRYVPPSHVEHLTPEQIGTIPSNGYLRQWSAEARAEMDEAQVQGLNVARTGINLLTEGQREWLTGEQVQALSYAQFRYVPVSQVEHLTPEQIGTIPSNGYLRQWSAEARAELDEAQVQGLNVARTGINLLSTEQREWLSTDQIQSLSYTQFRYVPVSRIPDLTLDQISSIPSRGYFNQLSAVQKDALTHEQIQALTSRLSGVTFDGTDGADTITGNSDVNNIRGGAGDDTLSGGAGKDVLAGGGGDDILDGGSGDDLLIGGGGSDTLSGGAGDDRLDLAMAQAGDTYTVDGGSGADTLDLGAFAPEDIALADGRITVTLLDGGQFHIDHTGVERIETAAGAIGIDGAAIEAADQGVAPVAFPYVEDFADNAADGFDPLSGRWEIVDEAFKVSEVAQYANGVAVLDFDGALPEDFQVGTTLEGHDEAGKYQNGFIIFDYQGPDDFKFAGARIGANYWTIGAFSGGAWQDLATLPETINPGTANDMHLSVEGSSVQLSVNGQRKLTHDFGAAVNDGQVGLATQWATSSFDDIEIGDTVERGAPQPVVAVALPYHEDFTDGVANGLDATSGRWQVADDGFKVDGLGWGARGVAVLEVDGALPEALDLSVRIEGHNVPGKAQNGFVIFDYQGPDDFKYAGARIGADYWTVGHYSGGRWNEAATLSEDLAPDTPYDLQVRVEGDRVDLVVDGVDKVSHVFDADVTGGQVGLAADSATTTFDDFNVEAGAPAPVAEADPPAIEEPADPAGGDPAGAAPPPEIDEPEVEPAADPEPAPPADTAPGDVPGNARAIAPAPATPTAPSGPVEVDPPLNNSIVDPVVDGADENQPAPADTATPVVPANPVETIAEEPVVTPPDAALNDTSAGSEVFDSVDLSGADEDGGRARPAEDALDDDEGRVRESAPREAAQQGDSDPADISVRGDDPHEAARIVAGLTSTPDTPEWTETDRLAILDPQSTASDTQRLVAAMNADTGGPQAGDDAPRALDEGAVVGRDADHSGSPFDMIDGTLPFDEVFETDEYAVESEHTMNILPPAAESASTATDDLYVERGSMAEAGMGRTAGAGMMAQLWGLLRSTFGSSRRADNVEHDKAQHKR